MHSESLLQVTGLGTRGSWQSWGGCTQTTYSSGAQSVLKHRPPPGQVLLFRLRRQYHFPKSHQHQSQGLRSAQGGGGGTGSDIQAPPASQHPTANHVPARLASNEPATVSEVSLSVLRPLGNSSRVVLCLSLPIYLERWALWPLLGGERIIELRIYVCLPGPLRPTHCKVKAGAAQTTAPSHRSGPAADSLF